MVPMCEISRDSIRIPKFLNSTKGGFQSLEDGFLQAGMMADELVDGGSDDDGVLLVNEYFQMLL